MCRRCIPLPYPLIAANRMVSTNQIIGTYQLEISTDQSM